MSESKTYTDRTDGSTLEVRPMIRAAAGDPGDVLRFGGREAGGITDVDLARDEVQSLIEYAQQWLEDTKPKPPQAPGSVVRVPRASDGVGVILTRLNNTGTANLNPTPHRARWISQYGTFWTDDELVSDLGGQFEVIHDAGVER
jgi:hypothetical protein